MIIIRDVNGEELQAIMVALGIPATTAATDVASLAGHADCAGHTVFLPDKGTMRVRHTENGTFTIRL